MNKTLLIIGLLATTLVACNDNKKKESNETVETSSNSEGMNIAFYVQDSVPNQFEFYKTTQAELEAKAQAFQNKLIQLQNEYQSLGGEFQRKVQANVLSQNQIQAYQQRIANKEAQIMQVQQNEGGKLEQEQFEGNVLLINKIEEYAQDFAKQNGYTIFLSKSTGGNVMFVDSSMDVTTEFIAFMNAQEEALNNSLTEDVSAE